MKKLSRPMKESIVTARNRVVTARLNTIHGLQDRGLCVGTIGPSHRPRMRACELNWRGRQVRDELLAQRFWQERALHLFQLQRREDRFCDTFPQGRLNLGHDEAMEAARIVVGRHLMGYERRMVEEALAHFLDALTADAKRIKLCSYGDTIVSDVGNIGMLGCPNHAEPGQDESLIAVVFQPLNGYRP